MSIRNAALATAMVAAGLGLASCGGDPTVIVREPATTPGEPQSRETAIRIASNGKFDPSEIYAKTSPGVVTIRSVLKGTDTLGIFGGGPQVGQGSGFVIDDSGKILTNAHVVTEGGETGNGRLTLAKEVSVEFGDRNRVLAKVVGFDPFVDVALLKISPEGLDLRPLTLSDGKGLAVGQPVAAIGSPFGEEGSLSIGVISATDRTIKSLTRFGISSAIQTDASINPGNSGGPLLNADGEVIGINQQIQTSSGSNSGVGFAVPVSAAKRSLAQLDADGKAEYPYIGVTSHRLYPQLADKLGLKSETGVLVVEVVSGSPADDAGVKAGSQDFRFLGESFKKGGDVIVAVDGRKLVGDNDLVQAIEAHNPGETVTLDILRDGSVRQIDVKLETRPTTLKAEPLGLAP